MLEAYRNPHPNPFIGRGEEKEALTWEKGFESLFPPRGATDPFGQREVAEAA